MKKKIFALLSVVVLAAGTHYATLFLTFEEDKTCLTEP